MQSETAGGLENSKTEGKKKIKNIYIYIYV